MPTTLTSLGLRRMHDLVLARLKRSQEALEVLRPGVAATVYEVRLHALALGPGAHRGPLALPVAAPHRPHEDDVARPDVRQQLRDASVCSGAEQVLAGRCGQSIGTRPAAPHLVDEVH